MFSLVIVHEDGAVISQIGLPEAYASERFYAAGKDETVLYAHFWDEDASYRVNHYVKP